MIIRLHRLYRIYSVVHDDAPTQQHRRNLFRRLRSVTIRRMGEYVQRMLAQDWRPTSRYSVAAWLVFYIVFLLYAFSQHGAFLFIDLANLVVHEGGHLLFGWFGPTLGLWGGTILQWLVPLLLAAYFLSQRQAAAFAFCLFFFFENWLYTATYMADARAMLLPLVTAGDSDYIEHDWHTIFSSLGVLQYDTKIAAVISFLGWCGMIGTVAWLARRSFRDVPAERPETKASAI